MPEDVKSGQVRSGQVRSGPVSLTLVARGLFSLLCKTGRIDRIEKSSSSGLLRGADAELSKPSNGKRGRVGPMTVVVTAHPSTAPPVLGCEVPIPSVDEMRRDEERREKKRGYLVPRWLRDNGRGPRNECGRAPR